MNPRNADKAWALQVDVQGEAAFRFYERAAHAHADVRQQTIGLRRRPMGAHIYIHLNLCSHLYLY
jgi:hypothetical protein